MSWRTVVISQRAKLELQLNHLVVRRPAETIKVYLGEIAVLIVESTAVSLTAALLAELTKRKIKVIFCDEKRNPHASLIPYYGSFHSSDKIRRQVDWSEEYAEIVWTEIVRDKITKQMEFLQELKKEKEAALLAGYLDELELGDRSNREGHAAKVYFNALFGKDFNRNSDSLVNAALDYGYAIILSTFNRHIVAHGYLTQLGIAHDNQFNYFNLSSDLMEPFRILVDRRVYAMELEEFATEEKHHLIDLLNSQVYVDGKLQRVYNAIDIYCKSVIQALETHMVFYIKVYRNEL